MRNGTWRALMRAAGMACVGLACGGGGRGSGGSDNDPPEVQLGERLFRETRFAQFFEVHSNGDVNAPLANGDPVMDQQVTTGEPLPGRFRGQSMNCRSCHLVDELQHEARGGVRTYDDFGRRSPIPARDDEETATPRNSPTLVNATLARDVPQMLHFDGEFPSITDLGVWNVFANPDMPAPQAALAQILCAQLSLDAGQCVADQVLPSTIGRFKTPTVRDLGQSQPYLHTGEMDTIEDVIDFYISVSALARQGRLRNGAPELNDMLIDNASLAPLAAFLRALNEDYS